MAAGGQFEGAEEHMAEELDAGIEAAEYEVAEQGEEGRLVAKRSKLLSRLLRLLRLLGWNSLKVRRSRLRRS